MHTGEKPLIVNAKVIYCPKWSLLKWSPYETKKHTRVRTSLTNATIVINISLMIKLEW